jgi:rhodanese-related sulfurtransferase
MSVLQMLALVSLVAVTQAGKTRVTIEHTTDTLAVVKENVAKGKAVLVDVRGPSEWKKGHIEGAIFLPVDSLGKNVDREMLAKSLPKDKILYTFCAVGVRARTAAKKLHENGYPVRALKPGYDDLVKAGFKKGKNDSPALEAAIRNENTRQRNAR